MPGDPATATLSPLVFAEALEAAAGQSPATAESVVLMARLSDGSLVPAETLLPVERPLPPDPDLSWEPPPPPSGPGVDHPGPGQGALSGKTIYISQCHGWIWYESLGRFSTQRGELFDTVEDFHNPEGADAYLVRYLENAGAMVVTARERDHNPEMVIVDDGDPDYVEDGAGFADGPAGFGPATSYPYGSNPFALGSTRRFPDGTGASVTWSLSVPTDGEYAIYVSYDAASDQSREAHYRITHPGGVIDRHVDQRVHGSTWVYLEQMWLPAGSDTLTVELLGDGAAGEYLSADAVRIGGGMGDVTRFSTNTGRPRWEEGALLATQWYGAPTSAYDAYGDGIGYDPSARSRYAAWRSPAGEDAVYLSWHSNAGGGTGTSTYTYEGSSGPAVVGSTDFAELVQGELVSSIRALWDSGWSDRGTRTAAFAETSPYSNPDMPAILVELAFHDHEVDVELLKHPRFRKDASRAMLRGIVRYFAERDGTSAAFLPEPPEGLSVRNDGEGNLVATWTDGASGAPYGDAPTAWRVYTSADGRSWDNGTDVSTREYVVPGDPGEAVYVRVTATNTGGESFPTEVMGARRMPADLPPVLVVAAFDRLDVNLLPWEYDVPALGDLKRMNIQSRTNPFDGVGRHGRAIVSAGWYFDAIADERLPDVDLSKYRAVVWITGEESTFDESFSTAQQATLRAYVEGGGTMWVSGAEILWDLDYLGTSDDQAFAADILGAGMEEDDADVYTAVGTGILDGLTMNFDEASGAQYDVEWPDVLSSSREVIATYTSGGAAAVLGDGVAMFGFPVETIGDEDVRASVAGAVLAALVPDWEPPDLSTPSDDGGGTGGADGSGDDGGTADGGGGAGGAGTEPAWADGEAPGSTEDLSKLGGCGCAAGTNDRARGWWGALLLGGLVALRRRRQTK